MIPKVIHYCWFGGNPKPKELEKYIESWHQFAPDYEIKEWNESNFDVTSHPFMKSAYDQKAWAFVSDYARLKIIEENGGIYLDTDVELLKNPDFLLEHPAWFAAQQNHSQVATGLGFGAEAHNPVLQEMMKIYDDKLFKPELRDELVCPRLNTEVMKNLGWNFSEDVWIGQDAAVYPPRYFDPMSTGNTQNLFCDDTVSCHHYSASWMPASRRLKRKVANILGPENTYKIKKLIKKK